MPTPLIFVSTFRVRPGRSGDELTPLVADFVDSAERGDGIVGLQLFLDESKTQLTYVQTQTDAAAMDAHLERAGDHIAAVVEIVEPTSILVGGQPGPLLAQVLDHLRSTGADVCVLPLHLGGHLVA